jgi:hypothetical protein
MAAHDNDFDPYPNVSETLREAVARYAKNKPLPPGGFLEAVIRGDDDTARSLASEHNRRHYAEIKSYVDEHVPERMRPR